MSIKLSIIIPCYKVEEYLPRCLDSLVKQSLKEIELICINDGSPDNCLKILKDYRKKYGSKIVIIDKLNQGVWRGRMDGIKIAKGEYIGFIDSDDYVRPGFCKKLYSAAKKSDADITVCGFSRIDLETGKVYSNEMCSPKRDIVIGRNTSDILAINGAPWNKIYKSEVLRNLTDLKNPPKVLDDMMFLLLAYLNTNTITFIPDNLICYMVRESSIVNTIRQEQLDSTYPAMLEVKKIYQKDQRKDIFLPLLEAMAYLHFGISLMFRMSYNKEGNFEKTLINNYKFLDKNFSGWRHNQYLKLPYIISHSTPNSKLGVVHLIDRLGLLGFFLRLYRFMIDKFKFDIKW